MDRCPGCNGYKFLHQHRNSSFYCLNCSGTKMREGEERTWTFLGWVDSGAKLSFDSGSLELKKRAGSPDCCLQRSAAKCFLATLH